MSRISVPTPPVYIAGVGSPTTCMSPASPKVRELSRGSMRIVIAAVGRLKQGPEREPAERLSASAFDAAAKAA